MTQEVCVCTTYIPEWNYYWDRQAVSYTHLYFETGEVVAALSEWVISKNLQPTRNLASEYIGRLQANGNKLKAINDTIRKYNHALLLCREGHEDMASIQLRRILSQNPKLIKGYHLLALIQIKNGEWSRARRTLRKAAKIDKTNTTTLRFLREVDEQTGVTTRLEKQKKGFFRDNNCLLYTSQRSVKRRPVLTQSRRLWKRLSEDLKPERLQKRSLLLIRMLWKQQEEIWKQHREIWKQPAGN